jgi:predicted Rdx family selenoprotein
LIIYRSRDYGVSFLYPWQYAFVSARAVANGDASLRPQSDGHEGQFTLARIEVPKGFYADTNYESGYFTLSLNQELSEQECESALSPGTGGKVEIETINGVEFRWVETDSGGRGHASRLRQYVTFTNGTCYELEMGVKTSGDNGLAREVDPDQVLRRLDTILRTVKILPGTEKPAAAEVESSTAAPAPVSQN